MSENPGQRFMSATARKDWPEAEAALRDLLLADPRNAALHCNLARVLNMQGRPAEAFRSVRDCLTLDPDHRAARFEKASCLMALGRLDDAEAAFTAYLRSYPDDTDAHAGRARLRLRLGDPQRALEDCERALKGAPELKLPQGSAALVGSGAGKTIPLPLSGRRDVMRAAIVTLFPKADTVGTPLENGAPG
ncbi:tetratricopeptide repeat protein [Breoghania sp.]|uniref:tetratricopeptide repeat protein n=1 Tax=Breoghania sp. TaxID=2065378 RepID=UPI002AABBAD2|nr:tetratricopeptide repeat protein [Breoghania sp.]